jgi:hypothetical protein
MLSKIVHITSNNGYKKPKENFSSLKNLFRESESQESGDKIELSPALKFLKKLGWNLKEVKVHEEKYYVSFSCINIDFHTFLDMANISANPHLDYKISSLVRPSPEDLMSMPDLSAVEIELNLSAAFYRKQYGFLGMVGKESSPENLSESDMKDLMKKMNELFGKLFFVYAQNTGYQSQKINELAEDSVEDLRGLTIINDLLILFLEKLTGTKISGRIIPTDDNEPPILINSVSLKNLP